MKSDPQMVLLIGAARSGTKFVRDTIAAAPLVARIPYDVNHIWRQGHEDLPHDELPDDDCTEALATRIRDDILGLVDPGEHTASPAFVLEKTVSNTLRVPFIDRVFPGARYIHLIRDGREVVESAYRKWQETPKLTYLLQKARTFRPAHWRYAIKFVRDLLRSVGSNAPVRTWGPVYRGMRDDLRCEPLEIVVARQWRRCVEASLRGLDSAVEPDRVFTLHYGDLVSSDDWIPAVMSFLGVAPEAIAPVRTRYSRTLRRPDRSWSDAFSPEQIDRILLEIEETVGGLDLG